MVQMTRRVEKKGESFEDAISKAGYGLFNVILLFIGGGCLMSVIMETMGMMFVMPAAECDLKLNLTNKSILASISFAGVVLSSHLWGFLADTKGRKKVLLISLIVGVVSSFFSSLAPNPQLLIILRFINGFFIGGASAVTYAYVGEFHNQRFRPKVVAWIATFVALGNMSLPALSWLILPLHSMEVDFLDTKLKPWRMLLFSFGAPSLLFAIGLYFLPESPKFLLAQGRRNEALQVLQTIYSVNTRRSKESFPVSAIIWDDFDNQPVQRSGLLTTVYHQTAPLFKTPYLLKTLMVCLLQFGTFATSSGFFMWYPTIVNMMEVSKKDIHMCDAMRKFSPDDDQDEDYCSVEQSVYHSSIMIGAALVIVYILSGVIINRMGPKNLLIFILVSTTVSGIAAQYTTGNLWAKILIGIFLLSSSGVGIINTIVVDLYPTQLRGMALAMSLMAGRFGAVVGSHIAGFLVYKLCNFTFYVYAADHLLLVFIIILLPTSPKVKQIIQPVT